MSAAFADPTPSPLASTPGTAPSTDPSAPATPSAPPTDLVSEPPTEGDFIGVTLTNSAEKDDNGDPAPVPNVKISVTDSKKTEVGSGLTDSVGKVFIPIPGPDTYTVTLDAETLPADAKLTSNKTSLTKKVFLSGGTFMAFPINAETIEKVPFGERFTNALISGIKYGLIIALAALGLSLIFGTTGLTNFAHGELVTFGALIAYFFNAIIGIPVILAGVVAFIAGGLFGYANDRVIWRPLRHRGTGLIAMMIVSIGLGLFLRSVYQYLIGSGRRSFDQYVDQEGRSYGPFELAPKEVAIMVVAVVAIAIVCVAIMKTRIGKAMRAVSDNPALAASSGMRVDRVITVVWMLGGALTALSGVLFAVNSQITFDMGFKILLLTFAGVTLGGLGTVWGALIGSLVIGILVEVGPLFGVPGSIKEIGALAVLILILLFRPQGIMGRRERVG